MKNTIATTRNRAHPKCIVCSLADAKGLHLKFGWAEWGKALVLTLVAVG